MLCCRLTIQPTGNWNTSGCCGIGSPRRRWRWTGLRRALDAEWYPGELREQYNAAASEKRVAQAALGEVPAERGLSRELGSYIDRLDDIANALSRADPEQLGELYASLRLALTYHHAEQIVDVEIDPLADRLDELVSEEEHTP